VAGHTVTSQDLGELKKQRTVANEFMRNCTEIGFKKVSKIAFEEERRKDDKNPQARQQALFQLFNIRTSLYERKSRPRYFDLGLKFDDLLEFKLWQAVADKLDIKLDEDHVTALLHLELFSNDPRIEQRLLDPNDFAIAQRDVKRNFQDVNDAYMRRAIAEEFRVRIAQEAVLLTQPFQFYTRRRPDGGFAMKFSNAEMPDETRAPLTLAQLWEAYKTQRSEYNVTLIPVHVEDFIKDIKDEPNELQKAEYFKAHKDKAADPSAEDRGLQLQMRVKIDYVLADPTSKEYLGVAKAVAQLKTTNPIYLDAVQSPVTAAYRTLILAQKHRGDVESQYFNSTKPSDRFDYRGTSFAVKGAALPIMTWLAKRHPEAPAGMLANGLFANGVTGPTNDLGALAGYMAWGALKHPEVLEASMKAEANRRGPAYAGIVAAGAASPFATVPPFFFLGSEDDFPRLPVETVQLEIEDILANRAAEERAQQNMHALRIALEKADGDSEKFRRVLNKLVPEMNLTYGPAKKDMYFNRFSVDDAKELEPLKEAYLKYLHLINLFEARDMTPERLLKADDFQKLFFDSSEAFSAASPYRAMPWPPKAKTNPARIWKGADPRLIDPKQIREKDFMNFKQQLDQNDPLKPPPDLDLFKDAEKPILFWRTAERIPERPSDYAEIERNMKKFQADGLKAGNQAKKMEENSAQLAKLRKQHAELEKAKGKEADLKKITDVIAGVSTQLRKMEREAQGNATALRARQVELKEKEADLEEVKRLLVEGWRFDRARTEKALPRAEEIARELLTNLQKTKLEIVADETAKLKRENIVLSGLAPMFPEMLPDKTVDYFKPPLPKDKIPFARDDTMDQAVRLFNLKEPIKIDNKALDDLNKALFDKARNKKNPEGEYVQILTNKPRSAFYVAVVTLAPRPDPIRFNITMRGIYNAMEDPGPQARIFPRDRFAERIQQQDAKVFRANLISYFKSENSPLGKFDILKEDAKKEFDDRGAGGGD
jgi:hypothetical protein